ncbi:MAG: Rieske 2Fe-2S domain-containing protein [Planctomycetales bacterium]
MAKKLSTQEILAAARAEKAKQAAASAEGAAPPAPAEAAESAPAEIAPQPAPPKKAAGTPKSTKDILAAARAQKAAGAAATVEKPVPSQPAKPGPVGKAVAKTGQPAAAAGERPSVQEMLKAVREGRKPAEEAPAPPALRKPKKPVLPSKPIPRGATAEEKAGRRNVLLALVATPFAAAWTMFGVASAAGLLGMARFMMPNIVNEPPSRFKVGSPGDYAPGTVSTKYTAQYGVWVVNAEYQGQGLIYALISICTHLGCTPNWLEGEQKFKCPCHGSGFYITGINFEGPAPRPLERAGIRIAPDGMIEVDKSVKFQQELGQWEDPASKVEVA